MLHRDDPDGLIVITQPAHAWLSGQLAHAWGNAQFSAPEPRASVCLAAEQHDIGWLDWELVPSLNLQTGRPHTFMELPVRVHTRIWASAGRLAMTQGGRYAALLVSLHGSGLYERRDTSADTPQDVQMIREYLAEAHDFEQAMLSALRSDTAFAPFATDQIVARNRRLVGVWDYLSLVICMGLRAERTFEKVPSAAGEESLTLTPRGGDATKIAVRPWPFSQPVLSVVCEGRRLPQTFSDESAMQTALRNAPPVWLTFELSQV